MVVTIVDPPESHASGSTGAAGTVLRLLGAIPGRRDDAVAIVNGLFGDSLDERDSRLATPMTIRAGETVLPLDREELPGVLADAVPFVSPRICVLVHGLMSTESIWRFPNDASTTYGTLLADDHYVTVCSRCATTPAATSPPTGVSSPTS